MSHSCLFMMMIMMMVMMMMMMMITMMMVMIYHHQIVEFPDMSHGWLPRGDMSKPEVARDVKKTMENLIAFFAKNL